MEFVANTIDVHTEPREDRSRRNLSHAFTQVNSICQRLFNNLPTREYTSFQTAIQRYPYHSLTARHSSTFILCKFRQGNFDLLGCLSYTTDPVISVSTFESNMELYRYDPSAAAAGLFTGLFFSVTFLHLYQMIRTRTWIFIPFIIGGTMEAVGYIGVRP